MKDKIRAALEHWLNQQAIEGEYVDTEFWDGAVLDGTFDLLKLIDEIDRAVQP